MPQKFGDAYPMSKIQGENGKITDLSSRLSELIVQQKRAEMEPLFTIIEEMKVICDSQLSIFKKLQEFEDRMNEQNG